jgi:ABC-type ATPase involved in cell division
LNSREKLVELVTVTVRSDAGYIVFENLNFVLLAGETAIIRGATGSGKTALAELIVGQRSPDLGTIKLFGHPLNLRNRTVLSQTRRRIGGVGGIFSLIDRQTVSDNLLYPLLIRGDSRASQKSRLKQALTQFNLLGRKRDKITALTRGEKLMVMFARAVIADQPLLLIDEPLDLLELPKFEEVINILQRLSAAGHALLILTSGQRQLVIPGAAEFELAEGRLR